MEATPVKDKGRTNVWRQRKHDYSSRRTRRKYTFSESTEVKLTSEDEQILARLVERYGKDFIANAAGVVRKRARGRPNKGPAKFFEKAHFASWVDERIEEYRAARISTPVKRARTDAFHMENGWDIPSPTKQQLDTIKKRHLLGRKILDQIQGMQRRKP